MRSTSPTVSLANDSLGQYTDAIAAFEKVITIKPTGGNCHVEAVQIVGLFLLQQQRLEWDSNGPAGSPDIEP